jgi:hypothetical protein
VARVDVDELAARIAWHMDQPEGPELSDGQIERAAAILGRRMCRPAETPGRQTRAETRPLRKPRRAETLAAETPPVMCGHSYRCPHRDPLPET